MIPEVFYTFEYDYDHNWRQTDTRLIMGGEVTTLTSMVYGEHEMLMSKKLHRIAGQQPWYALDYQYNIRGWLTGINTIDPSQPDNYFSMALYYENPPQVQGVDFQPQYNGNISAMQWHTTTVEEVEGTNAYSFMYDELNRLTDAIFYHTDLNRQVSISQNGEMPQKHNEGLVTGIGSVGNIQYDKNGNILHVDRLFRQHSSNVKADLLDYTYDGNRLIAVDDQVIIPSELDDFRDNGYYYSQHGQAEYDYDFNGNMVFDLNREMKLQYGQLSNLPTLIGWRGGLIENQYTFDGQKLGKKVYDYRGNLTLNERYFDELLMQNGKVRRLQHADGYVSLTQSGAPAAYFYYLKDHLGNVRATLTHTALTGLAISQANDYDPFGLS